MIELLIYDGYIKYETQASKYNNKNTTHHLLLSSIS